MKKSLLFATVLLLLVITQKSFAQDDLDNYINRLKKSEAAGGSETAFLSAGSYFLYGQGYFENKNYSSAVSSFGDAVKKDPDNAYANYQLAISLIRQNDQYKTQLAQEYLQKAFSVNPSLKDRYAKDVPTTKATIKKNAPGLEGFIEKLKYSRSTGGKETEMNSAGLDAMYGIEYYEANKYDNAEIRFRQSLAKDADNPYVNYLMAVSLAAQNKQTEAKAYLNKAVSGNASLGSRFQKEAAKAKTSWDKQVKSKQIKTTPSTKIKPGGQLVFGNYTCHQTIWNGPNISPAYRFDYKGYFQLRADGTYRWLDDGEEGRYSYDPATGVFKWLSGYFAASKPKLTTYVVQPSGNGQATVNFTDSYRWECGCKKK
jgi:tetratricopeptide (TPR) repeat protein